MLWKNLVPRTNKRDLDKVFCSYYNTMNSLQLIVDHAPDFHPGHRKLMELREELPHLFHGHFFGQNAWVDVDDNGEYIERRLSTEAEANATRKDLNLKWQTLNNADPPWFLNVAIVGPITIKSTKKKGYPVKLNKVLPEHPAVLGLWRWYESYGFRYSEVNFNLNYGSGLLQYWDILTMFNREQGARTTLRPEECIAVHCTDPTPPAQLLCNHMGNCYQSRT